MNGGGSSTEHAGSPKATKHATATVDLSSVVVVTGDDENDEGDEEASPRRQSQSSSHTRTTASVNDLSSGGDEDDDEVVVGENTRQPNTAARIDVTVDSRNKSGGESSRGSCCDSEVDTTRSSSRCTGQMQMVEWTKSFHSLVDEAPLLQSTIISCTGNIAQNGVYSNGKTSSFSRGKAGNGDDVDGGRGNWRGGGSDGHTTSENCKTKEEENYNGIGCEKMETCDWINTQLLEEGRQFVRRNFFAVFLAHFIGIAFLLTVRPIQALLLRTSALHRKENTLRRYVKLILYLKRFYEAPQAVVKKKSAGSSSPGECHNTSADIMYIQRLQRNAAKNFKVYVPPPWEDIKLTIEEQEIYQAVQEDTKQLDDKHGICTNTKILPKVLFTVNPDVPMSQYDLVIIQQAFFGLIAQFPRIFGIYDKSGRDGNLKGMQGFIHLWAVLGHVFGIEERFNLCLARNYDKETNQLIFKQVFLFSFKTLNESALRLWRSMTKGSSRYFFFFRTKAMMLFMSKDVAQLDNCKHLYSVMKPMEKFCYYFCKFLLDWILWISLFRVGFNYSLRLSILICQYFLERAKKCESRWDGAPTSICVIEPSQSKESNGIKK